MKIFVYRAAILAALLFLFGCLSAKKAQEIDRSYLNQPQADLKSDLNKMMSPASGLRSANSGSSSCSLCAK